MDLSAFEMLIIPVFFTILCGCVAGSAVLLLLRTLEVLLRAVEALAERLGLLTSFGHEMPKPKYRNDRIGHWIAESE
jgi:hypothetical protein